MGSRSLIASYVVQSTIPGSKMGRFTTPMAGKRLVVLDFGSEIWEDEAMTRLLSRLRDRVRLNGNGHTADRGPVRRESRMRYVVTAAESAPCTCPDFCERDHGAE